jgi:ABC-2 type transport system permease protein
MAVYERTYRTYEGVMTPHWSRFLIIPRYAYRDVFRSKLFTAYFVACLMPTAVCTLGIYLKHNLKMLEELAVNPADFFPIGAEFFFAFIWIQSFAAFLLVLIVGPALISADVQNNALPLYLCRPFSRSRYILGKMSVLLILLSCVTWIPGLFLYSLHGYMEGGGWLAENARIGWALFASAWMWILVLSLLALSLSAYVKRKTLSRSLLLAVFFISGAFGAILQEGLRIRWGALVNIGQLLGQLSERLFGIQDHLLPVPAWSAVAALAALCAFCLFLLYRKVKAYEVVRS